MPISALTLVAVEASGPGLVPVAGLGVDRRDHPVLGDFAGDAEDAVVSFCEVLAGHSGEQLGGFGDDRVELLTIEKARHA